MSDLKVVLWTGADAPNRNAQLKIVSHYYDEFSAYWEPGYCGCADCRPIVGHGRTESEAVADYWEKWSERYE